jgi:DNA-binding winged helix-turn-helix (wHTH) protein/Tol biopolymer transport system component
VPVTVAVFEFGDFKLDCDRFELSRAGKILKLERKPMELLILLASRNGQLVTRTEIAQHVWGTEVFVDTEHGINTAIRKIRHILGDDSEKPRFVETVTGKGYRFSAPILPPAERLEPATTVEPAPAATTPPKRELLAWSVVATLCSIFVIVGVVAFRSRPHSQEVRYTQLTDFTDSAVSPALSPDGRMLAFIRGSGTFMSADQIYVKMLPQGEARRVTDDKRIKYGLAFSPDGSDIAYTVLDTSKFATYTVSALGGDPQLFLNNAAGLSWLSPDQILFSRVNSGIHLGVVTATVTGDHLREIYFPSHERGMAHFSSPSPDRHWILVVEMNRYGGWAPCRLVSLEGHSPTKSVGPAAACTSAGWSPDGSWMYFTADVRGHSHVWRQHFPDGSPEQITFGPTDDQGLAVEPSGQSLITSVGSHQSDIWIHEPTGDRPLTSEGEVVAGLSTPVFSQNDTILYYLLQGEPDESGAELWRTNVGSGKSEALFPGVSMLGFDVSPDGQRVVYVTPAPGGKTQLWLAPVDRSSPASKVGNIGGLSPHFGPNDQIIFERAEGNANYLEQVRPDGSGLSRVVPYSIIELQNISPGRRWLMAVVPAPPGVDAPAIMAIPLDGGSPRRMCVSYCFTSWSTSGKFLFIPVEASSRTSPGRSLAIPVGPGENLPDLPPEGIQPMADPSVVHGAQSFPHADFVPGRDLHHFAYVKTTEHRNLYRISLP